MTDPSGNAPAWLFAFVDLAFLLLIGMTQLSGNPNAPELGEMPVPKIGGDVTSALQPGARDLWQLRVYPADEDFYGPFELVVGGGEGSRVSFDELRTQLGELRGSDEPKPLLAPHADSRSQDFLDAVQLLDETWPSRRRTTVERVLDRQ
jgi:hypothetical protein